MDLSNITPESVVAQQAALTSADLSTRVLRRVLDVQAAEGAMLVQMMNQQAGLGQNVDATV